jgi:hypothetical protein
VQSLEVLAERRAIPRLEDAIHSFGQVGVREFVQL